MEQRRSVTSTRSSKHSLLRAATYPRVRTLSGGPHRSANGAAGACCPACRRRPENKIRLRDRGSGPVPRLALTRKQRHPCPRALRESRRGNARVHMDNGQSSQAHSVATSHSTVERMHAPAPSLGATNERRRRQRQRATTSIYAFCVLHAYQLVFRRSSKPVLACPTLPVPLGQFRDLLLYILIATDTQLPPQHYPSLPPS